MAEAQNANVAKEQDLNQLLKVRREKLAALQENGKDPFQITKYDQTHHTQEAKDLYEAHEAELLAGRPEPNVEGLDEQQAKAYLQGDFLQELAQEAENMLNFMDEVTMAGYGKLLSTGKEYYEDAEKIHELMENFAAESETIEKITDSIKESVEAVTEAMEESARGTMNVATTSTELSASIENIEKMAMSNKGVADELANEVGKFKLE